MAVETGELSLLGESADWLKDSDGVSLSEYRRRVVERLGSCWRHPTDAQRFARFERRLIVFFQGLFFNKLYPEDLFFIHDSPADPRNFIPRSDHLAEDAPRLDDFCRLNRLGMGELHVLYIATALCRRVFEDPFNENDLAVEQRLGSWLMHPMEGTDEAPMGSFSEEALQRFRALRAIRVMQQHGLADDRNDSQLTIPDRLKIVGKLVGTAGWGMSRYCSRRHWLPLLVLEFATAMEEHVRSRAEARVSKDERTSEEIAKGLLHCMRQVAIDDEMSMARRLRLADLLLTILVRGMSRIETHVGVMVYTKLRARSSRRPRISHKSMFEALPNDDERTHLLNFLYAQGQQNPMHYIERFSEYFEHEGPRFASKEVGFRLKTES